MSNNIAQSESRSYLFLFGFVFIKIIIKLVFFPGKLKSHLLSRWLLLLLVLLSYRDCDRFVTGRGILILKAIVGGGFSGSMQRGMRWVVRRINGDKIVWPELDGRWWWKGWRYLDGWARHQRHDTQTVKSCFSSCRNYKHRTVMWLIFSHIFLAGLRRSFNVCHKWAYKENKNTFKKREGLFN